MNLASSPCSAWQALYSRQPKQLRFNATCNLQKHIKLCALSYCVSQITLWFLPFHEIMLLPELGSRAQLVRIL